MSKLLFKLEHSKSLLEAKVEELKKQNETLKQQKSFLFEENAKESEAYDLLYVKYQELERKLAASAEVDSFLSSAKELVPRLAPAPAPEPVIKESSEPESSSHKRKDLRDTITSSKRTKSAYYKSLLCRNQICNYGSSCIYAHSIQDLNICQNGSSCPNRECSAMIHSSSERHKLKDIVSRKNLIERSCKYNKNHVSYESCPNTRCKYIHWNSKDGFIDFTN
jgi:hypothetical protein